jgi:cytochrome P450
MEAVDLGQSVPLIPLQVDPPEHRKYRRLLDPIFAPRRMNVLEPDITRVVNERIDQFIDSGRCDFATDFAVPLPSSVFLALVGLPLSELDTFLAMKDGILRPTGDDLDEIKASQKAAARRIEEYFAEAVKDRQKNRRDDLLSLFLDAEVDGDRLTDGGDPGHLLPVHPGRAGHGHRLAGVLRGPAGPAPRRAGQIVDDPAIIPSAVEELLRWETPVTTVARVATRDVELGGCPIHAGENIGVVIGSANTDEEACPAPTRWTSPGAPTGTSPSGGGAPVPGSNLARLELRVAMREWHRRIPEYDRPRGPSSSTRWAFARSTAAPRPRCRRRDRRWPPPGPCPARPSGPPGAGLPGVRLTRR